MPAEKTRAFLDNHGVKYVTIRHSPAFTAQEIAASAHIRGRELAKTVMVKIDGRMAMAVVPASLRVDCELLRTAARAGKVEIAAESEFGDLFPECELGAMPPFGNLYGMAVYAEESLAEDEDIAFNAGSHVELIQMRYQDYEELVKPAVARLCAGRQAG